MKKCLSIVLLISLMLCIFSSCSNASDLYYSFFEWLYSGSSKYNDPYYFTKSGWDSKIEASYFETVYCEDYREKATELKEKYELKVETLEEIEEDYQVWYFYNDTYTIYVLMRIEGRYEIYLYFYGNENASINDFESQRNVVNFINDFTNYVAYDTITEENCFERLYNEACVSEEGYATYFYHYDSFTGNVGYNVVSNAEGSVYDRQMSKEKNAKNNRNSFSFKGVLKPLGSDGIYCE